MKQIQLSFKALRAVLIVSCLISFQMPLFAQPAGEIAGKYTAKISECGEIPCDGELSLRKKSVALYQFSIVSGLPGPRPFICNLDGEWTLANGKAEWKSPTGKCELTFAFQGKQVTITAKDNDACRQECGAGAGFLGTYSKAPSK